MKLKFARYILKRTGDILLGRGMNFAVRIDSSGIPDGWICLSDFRTGIKNRPELGEYNRNRIHNMRLCVKLMNGVGIMPGQVFSMMRLVGDPTEKKGFAAGPVLSRGKLVMLDGGGLCQVSTAIFNSALLAGLNILEKHNHRYDYWGDARFIELGRDAAYAFILKDIKFKNRFRFPVRLRLAVDEQACEFVCGIYSERPSGETHTVRTEVLEEYRPDGFIPGWKVKTERMSEKDGVSRTTYSMTETYLPLKGKSHDT
ncbi:MAG: hypothetical protein A2Y33_02335 [Spirochaetes bacterium GWF1_51_8]|nr:MAG: hypothetical protein A2Y33_02335 [Spirochaetes bacterium GWF1_51_8]